MSGSRDILHIRVKPEDKELWADAAAKVRRSLSNWVVERLCRAAEEELAGKRMEGERHV